MKSFSIENSVLVDFLALALLPAISIGQVFLIMFLITAN